MRNVEVKALVKNVDSLISKAKSISGQNAQIIIKQHDTFYEVPQGRLKLRKFEDENGELIYYERPNTEGPKMCSYEKANISSESVKGIHSVLERALGVRNTVKKVRQLFLIGQTRIHIDSVEGLGNFMELEVVLNDDQSLEDGHKIASDLMIRLEIDKEDLISGAYADLLNT